MNSEDKNILFKNKGHTLIELAIVLAILMGLATAAFAKYSKGTKIISVEAASIRLRAFQLGVSTYYNIFQKVPTEKELYETILVNQPDLGYTVVEAVEFWNKCYCGKGTSLLKTGDPVHPWTEKFRMPKTWIILSKGHNLAMGAYFYAVDESEPVWVAWGSRPFSLVKALEKRPEFLQY